MDRQGPDLVTAHRAANGFPGCAAIDTPQNACEMPASGIERPGMDRIDGERQGSGTEDPGPAGSPVRRLVEAARVARVDGAGAERVRGDFQSQDRRLPWPRDRISAFDGGPGRSGVAADVEPVGGAHPDRRGRGRRDRELGAAPDAEIVFQRLPARATVGGLVEPVAAPGIQGFRIGGVDCQIEGPDADGTVAGAEPRGRSLPRPPSIHALEHVLEESGVESGRAPGSDHQGGDEPATGSLGRPGSRAGVGRVHDENEDSRRCQPSRCPAHPHCRPP
jgi:hypothetical protein